MIKRYQIPELESFFSESEKYQRWMLLEREVLYALSKALSISTAEIVKLERIFKELTINPEEVEEKEKEIKHDFVAFLRILEKKLSSSPIAKFLHYGLTSSDIIDTAQSLVLREINDILVEKIDTLQKTLRELSYKYLDSLQVGRTHGRHAEPVSFGYKFAITYQELEKSLEQLYLERRFVEVVSIKGSTGTYAHISPEVQEALAHRLRLCTIFGSTQAIPRNRYASYLSTLSVTARILNTLAVNLRTLAREEIAELSLKLEKEQVGSSSMPHKVNPVSLENIAGLARWIHGIATLSFENIELWDERDISHSSSERMSLIDAPTLLINILEKINYFLKQLSVNKEQIEKNLQLTKGIILSQSTLLALLHSPEMKSREIATKKIQQLVNEVREGREITFTDALSKLEEKKLIQASDVSRIRDLKAQLKYLPDIYRQIFSKKIAPKCYLKELSNQHELDNAIYYLAQRINWYYHSKYSRCGIKEYSGENLIEEHRNNQGVIIFYSFRKNPCFAVNLISLLSFPVILVPFSYPIETYLSRCKKLTGIEELNSNSPEIVESIEREFINSEEYQQILSLSDRYSQLLIVENVLDNGILLKSLFSILSKVENIREIKCASIMLKIVEGSSETIFKKRYYRPSLFSQDYQGSLLEKEMREYNFKYWTKDSTAKLFNWYGLLLRT